MEKTSIDRSDRNFLHRISNCVDKSRAAKAFAPALLAANWLLCGVNQASR